LHRNGVGLDRDGLLSTADFQFEVDAGAVIDVEGNSLALGGLEA